MGIGKGLKALRKNKNMTMEQLANDLNNKFPELMKLTKGKISKWENEKEEPRLSTAKILAEYFNVKINDLYSDSDTTYKEDNDITTVYNQLTPPRQHNVLDFANEQLIEQQNQTPKITLKRIHASAAGVVGEELFDDMLEEEVEFEANEVPKGADYCVLVNGDSMEPMIRDGSYAFIKKVDTVNDGTIALVTVDGCGFIKRVDVYDDVIKLISLNPKYDDIIVGSYNDMKVMGKVVL